MLRGQLADLRAAQEKEAAKSAAKKKDLQHKHDACIFSPEQPVVQAWTALMGFLIVLSGVTVPLQLAFDHSSGTWTVVSWVMDVCFCL